MAALARAVGRGGSGMMALLLFHRHGRQVGAIPAARLVAGRDGRSHAGQRHDPRRRHGFGRHLACIVRIFPLLAVGIKATPDVGVIVAFIGAFTA